MITLITRKDRAKSVADRWKLNYLVGNSIWFNTPELDSKQVYEALIDLGTSPDPDEVDRIIGNSSWTEVQECDKCGEHYDQIVEIDLHQLQTTTRLCQTCLRAALQLFGTEVTITEYAASPELNKALTNLHFFGSKGQVL